MKIGSLSAILHLTFINLISLSTTSGWKVTSIYKSSCGGKNPWSGLIVKNLEQNLVSQLKWHPISPRFDNWIVLVNLELITTAPNPMVFSNNFNSTPCEHP